MALQKINLIIPDDLKVDVIVPNVILGGADDYNKLANLPTFNGKEWKGPLTFESENIASKSELAALAGKVNTNKNDIDGLGDQIHEVEAKIPQAASDSNQLVDKASMTSAIAAVQKGVDNNAGDIAALSADLTDGLNQKADKATTYTKTEVDNAIKSLQMIKWVDTLPTTGDTKYLYAVAREEVDKDGNKIAALYLWDGTEWRGAGAFSLNIDPDTLATKTDLNKYLPLSGGTINGELKVIGPKSTIKTYSGDETTGYTRLELISGDENWAELRLTNKKGQTHIRQTSAGTLIYNTINNKSLLISSTLIFNNKVLDASDKAVANGVASLDEKAKIPLNQLPDAIIKINNDGIKGDYCSTYGILAAPNGVLTANGMKLTLKAGLVLQCAGQEAKTTIASDTVHEVESTQDFDFFYADGAFYEATQVVYSRTEPEDGDTGILAWWNPDVKKWKFKSNAAGNVWATANKAARLAHIHTDGNTITRIDYIGARVLDEGRLLQGLKKTVADLATGADSVAIIAKVNEILAALREAGILA